MLREALYRMELGPVLLSNIDSAPGSPVLGARLYLVLLPALRRLSHLIVRTLGLADLRGPLLSVLPLTRPAVFVLPRLGETEPVRLHRGVTLLLEAKGFRLEQGRGPAPGAAAPPRADVGGRHAGRRHHPGGGGPGTAAFAAADGDEGDPRIPGGGGDARTGERGPGLSGQSLRAVPHIGNQAREQPCCGGPMASIKEFQVTFDCAEPERVARFWCEVLGYVARRPANSGVEATR